MRKKVKVISSEYYEDYIGGGNLEKFEKAVNDFIEDKNVLDIQYRANEVMTVNCDSSNVGYMYSALIIYDAGYISSQKKEISEKKVIELSIGKDTTVLTNSELGEMMYHKQVEPKLHERDYQDGFILKFPKHIDAITTGFSEGLLKDIYKIMGYYNLKSKVDIDSPNRKIKTVIDVSLNLI